MIGGVLAAGPKAPFQSTGGIMEKKTFKREIALGLAIFLCFIAWKAAEAEPVETLKVIIWPIMLFVGAAFGMQWASKQTGLTTRKT